MMMIMITMKMMVMMMMVNIRLPHRVIAPLAAEKVYIFQMYVALMMAEVSICVECGVQCNDKTHLRNRILCALLQQIHPLHPSWHSDCLPRVWKGEQRQDHPDPPLLLGAQQV